MTAASIAPLDPRSATAHDFIATLADIQLAIDARKRAAEMREQPALGERVRRKAA